MRMYARPRAHAHARTPRAHALVRTPSPASLCAALPRWSAVALVTSLFREHVDTKQLVADLRAASERPNEWVRVLPEYPGAEAPPSPASKRQRAE